jgi:hypothetical protein
MIGAVIGALLGAQNYITLGISLFGLSIVSAAACAMLFAYFRANTGKQLIGQQSAAIEALQATNADQERRLKAFEEASVHMSSELNTLRELVTQAAKVDELAILVKTGFTRLGVNFG